MDEPAFEIHCKDGDEFPIIKIWADGRIDLGSLHFERVMVVNRIPLLLAEAAEPSSMMEVSEALRTDPEAAP